MCYVVVWLFQSELNEHLQVPTARKLGSTNSSVGGALFTLQLMVRQPLAHIMINSLCLMESSKLGGVVDHFSKVYALPPALDALLLHAR